MAVGELNKRGHPRKRWTDVRALTSKLRTWNAVVNQELIKK